MLADVSPDTTVKLIDFGLAALVKEVLVFILKFFQIIE